MNSRKELVEAAFDKLVNGNENERFLALKDLSEALQSSNDESYSNEQIEFFIIMTKFIGGINHEAIPEFKRYLGQRIFIRRHGFQVYHTINDQNAGFRDWLFEGHLTTIMNDLPQIWLKSLKYDAFSAKYEEWKAQKNIEQQENRLIGDIFQSFDNRF